MFAEIDLTELSELSSNEKTFLSVYLSSPKSLSDLDRRFERMHRVLNRGGSPGDENDHFQANAEVVREYLSKNPFKSGSLCLFSCWGLDFFRAYPLPVVCPDLVRFDSSPYIRPLAELEDEYENAAVVIADNRKARIFMVASSASGPESSVEGNIKNHVRKGGWSQQRYERRRDKQMLLYVREVVEALERLSGMEDFRRILLVGGKEVLRILFENLPPRLRKQADRKALDLGKGEQVVNREIRELFLERERRTELDLWEKIRSEYLGGGLGVVGVDEVWRAVSEGRAESVIVIRDLEAGGMRCRECENLRPGRDVVCTACGSQSLFPVDMVNEIVEAAKRSGAEVDFCDPIFTLEEAGGIAAFLRYNY